MPGIKGRLAIRVSDGHTDQIVTRYCTGLRFVKVAPGGHQELTFTMTVPRNTFTDLGPADRVWVYGTRTTRCIFDGYIENPTPVDGPTGQRYEIRAVGGMARASDESRALIYADRSVSPWAKDLFADESSNMDTGVWSTDPNAGRIEVQLPRGVLAATGTFAGGDYDALVKAGMNLGGIAIYCESGKSDAGYVASMVTPSQAINIGGATGLTTGGLASNLFIGTDFTATNYMALRLRRIGAGTKVADDDVWTKFGVALIGQRMDRNGTLLTGSTGLGSPSTVLAHQVAEDLLGRLLTFCDPGTAVIDPTTFAIDQLAFPDGVKAAGVLTELENWEPDHTWEIGEELPNGLHRFAYRAWPTEPRYEASVKDGWVQAGSDVDLCNRILVSWTDPAGKPVTTPVTAADLGLVGIGLPVDDLGDRVKDADPITLPEGFGSEANAIQIGGALLRDAISPPKAGTVVVRRPIVDHLTGNHVQPWELEPGYVCRVRETGDDLRVTQAAYDDDPVAMTLTLGRPVLTREQRLARLSAA